MAIAAAVVCSPEQSSRRNTTNKLEAFIEVFLFLVERTF